MPPVWAKRPELELPVIVQEVQPPRGVREGDADGELVGDLRRPREGIDYYAETRDEDSEPQEHAPNASPEREGESQEVLRDGGARRAVCHLRRVGRSDRSHRRPYWDVDFASVIIGMEKCCGRCTKYM